MDSGNRHYYVIFQTKAGWIGISGSSLGIFRTTLPQKSRESAVQSLGEDYGDSVYTADIYSELVEKLLAYFIGKKVVFPEKLDYSLYTQFEYSVWETTRSIPYGETRSYSWAAGQIDKPLAYRAVGQALGRNPFPVIVPCHRVLGKDGKLHGFGGGLEMKQYLLNLENNQD